jgi:hypothetical protein
MEVATGSSGTCLALAMGRIGGRSSVPFQGRRMRENVARLPGVVTVRYSKAPGPVVVLRQRSGSHLRLA